MDPANESNDPLKYFSRAYESYTKCPGKVNRMLATRAMMLAAAYLTNAGRHQVRVVGRRMAACSPQAPGCLLLPGPTCSLQAPGCLLPPGPTCQCCVPCIA
jgi:hypothetical protein